MNSSLGTTLLKFTHIWALAFWGQDVLNSEIAANCLGKCLGDRISFAELSQEVSEDRSESISEV